MQLVTIGTYDNLYEAELAKIQLESYNRPTVLKDAEMVHLMPIYNLTIGGIKLQVRDLDEANAKSLLIAMSEQSGATCPSCGSSDFISNYKSTKNKKGRLAVILSFLTGTYPPLHYELVNKCNECGETFDTA